MAHYLFGPVLSRRLGRSLGIDLMPAKTCSMNCIYCECGKTTDLTEERKDWIPTHDVVAELDTFLKNRPELDFITFSGAGEPCLHQGIGTIIQHLKTHYPQYKICLLTNSTPLVDASVRREVSQVDRIVPSLDAATDTPFRKITRPPGSIHPKAIIEALTAFKKDYPNVQMWLEIFIVPGVNDTPDEIRHLTEAVHQIHPDKVQLNMLDRPGCVNWIKLPTPEVLAQFKDSIEPYAPVEIVGKVKLNEHLSFQGNIDNLAHRIFATCLKRPCTLEDLQQLLNLPEATIQNALDQLTHQHQIVQSEVQNRAFYRGVED